MFRQAGLKMRITKEKRQENHDRIVAIASEMFRERGFDGVSVADLMESAAHVVSRAQVMEGVAEMIAEVQVEATFPDGTKLVTVHQPIR